MFHDILSQIATRPANLGPAWLTVGVASRILLLRHAQSTWNAAGRWQGWADPPPTPEGEQAAAAAGVDPALDGIAGAVTSDLTRARRTAELLGLPRRWPSPRPLRGLRERGAGRWTGLTRDEIERGWPGALTHGVAAIDGGEAPAAVVARAVASLHRIAAEWGTRPVVAVTHGALIRLVELHYGGAPAPIPNLSGRWIEVEGGRVALGPAVALSTQPVLAG